MKNEDAVIKAMDLDQKIGQLFTLGFCGTTFTPEARDMIAKLHVGGLRITPNVYLDYTRYMKLISAPSGGADKKGEFATKLSPFVSPDRFVMLLNEFQEMAVARASGVPLHISVDVSNVSRGGYPFFPEPMGFTCAGSRKLLGACMESYAACMRATGVNMVHFPCVDVVRQPESPEINTGSFSGNPDVVAEYGAIVAASFARQGVIATGKHFPGRGYSTQDVHYNVDVCPLSREELMNVDLLPYKRMIKEGLPAIMTAHSSYPSLSGDNYPATISAGMLQTIIRKELGFDGVITTDSITMEGIKKLMPTHEACARAIQAGADLILYKTLAPQEAALAMQTVKDWVRKGKITESRINESVRRVLVMKRNAGLLEGGWKTDPKAIIRLLRQKKHHALAAKAARAAALLIREKQGLLPIRKNMKILVVEQSMFTALYTNDNHYHPYMLWEAIEKRYPGSGLIRLDFCGDDEKLEEAGELIPRYDLVVATNYYSRNAAANTDFLNKLIQATGKDVIVFTDSPFPSVVSGRMKTVVCLFSQTPASIKVAVDILAGDLTPKTKMPVDYLRY